jgi:hypothetical protein
MFHRLQKYRTSVAMTRNETYKVDLPAQGSLSFIAWEIWAQQGSGAPFQATALGKWRAIDYIDNVIVRANGRSDIVNVPGRVQNYLTWLDQGAVAYDVLREYSAASQVSRGMINFGRRAWDPLFCLDLAQYDNIEFNLTNSWADTYWQGSPTLTLILGFLDGVGAPKSSQFFRKETWRTYTSIQDGREYLEVPVALPVRRVGFQIDPNRDGTTGVATTAITNVLYDLKMTFKSGALTPFDGRLSDLIHQNYYEIGKPAITWGAEYHNADRAFSVGIGDVRGRAGISGARDDAGSSTVPTLMGDENTPYQKPETYEADSPIDWVAIGAAYEHCAHFEFGDGFPEVSLLDASRNGEGIVELELHTRNASSAASGTVRVFLDRLARASDVG